MIKQKWLCLLCLGLAWSTITYSQEFSPEVLVTAGQTDRVSGSQISLSWTLGQLADATLVGEDRMLTEGFQQPNLFIESVSELGVADQFSNLETSLFPNPASEWVRVKTHLEKSEAAMMLLLDSGGKILRKERVDLQDYLADWDVSHLSSGTYLFQISTLNGQTIRTFRITKI